MNTSNNKPTTNAYAFLNKPIEIGKMKAFCLQIVGIDLSKKETTMSLGIGCI